MSTEQFKNPTQTERQAKAHGIDTSLLEYNLSLSFEKRLEQHDAALEVVLELEKARCQLTAQELEVILEKQDSSDDDN